MGCSSVADNPPMPSPAPPAPPTRSAPGVATALAAPRPLRVLAMSRDIHGAISQIRLVRALMHLAQAGLLALRLRDFHHRRRGDDHWADVVVLQRATGPLQLRWLRQWQALGVAVVVEIDDLLTAPAPHLAQHDALLASQPALRALLGEADVITVSTAPLAEALSATLGVHAPPVRLVPNCSIGFDGPPARHDGQRPISLIVASSDRQHLGALGDALADLLARNGAAAARRQMIELWGVGPVAAALQTCGLPHRTLPLLPVDQFLPTLAALPNPVGMLPLDGSDFSRCKSAVKFFDYAMAGIPSLCADREPYRAVVRPGVTGWLCADEPGAWALALSQVCAQAERRQAVAAAARADVLAQHTLAQMAQAWLAALTQARAGRQRRPAPWLRQAGDALTDAATAPWAALREANRRRLWQRQAGTPPTPRA